MKRILFLAIFSAGIFGFTQAQINVHGCLTTVPGTTAAYKTVTISFDSLLSIPPITVTTDSNGCYSTNFTTNVTQGMVRASMFNCLGVLTSSFAYFGPTTTSMNINLTYCSSVVSGCQASFSFQNPVTNTVYFNNTSTGTSSSTVYTWNFGDGITSTNVNPSHTYATPGVYVICLNIYNQNTNCTSTYCDSVNIISTSIPCAANFSFQSTGLMANFYNSSTSPNPATLTYLWNFGDNTSSLMANPPHTYRAPGTYNVCLMISNTATGCYDTICKQIVVQAANPCSASFTTNIVGNTASFTSTSTGTNSATRMVWNIYGPNGINYVGTGTTFSKSGLAAGPYAICLNISDSTRNCQSTMCDSFIVNGTPIGNNGCRASFTYQVLNNSKTVVFYSRSYVNSPNAVLSWNFGDGNYGTGPIPSHIYTNNGTYWVCLTVIDSANGAICRNTLCDSVQITGNATTTCLPRFTFNTTGNNVAFQNTSSVSSSALFNWNFGDGSTTNIASPTHTYTQNGTYTVCLTVSDSTTNCTNTNCMVVTIGGNSITCDINGYVLRDSMGLAVDHASVKLYELSNNGVSLKQTVLSNSNGYYHFGLVTNGNYFIAAEADSMTPNYTQYLPTYFGNVYYWFNASLIHVCPSRNNANIHLIEVPVNGGTPNKIQGNVSTGSHRVNSMAGYRVLVLNSNKDIVATTITESNGTYTMNNIPNGTYQVAMDVPGLTPAVVTVQFGSVQHVASIDFTLNSTYILASINAQKNIYLLNANVYPNPVGDEFKIDFNLNSSSDVQIEILNVTGQVIFNRFLKSQIGNSTLLVNSQNWKDGIYMLRITTNEGVLFHKIKK